MTSASIVRDFNTRYDEDYYAWNPFYPRANTDLRMYLGDQWDDQEKQKLFQENRNALVFNFIRRNINLLTGYQRKHRLSSVVIPSEDSDQQAADDMSEVLLHVMNHGDGYKIISESFGGGIKTGFNLMTVWMDFRDDILDGDIRFGREPYCGFITDPYFTQLDFSDCSHVIRRKYLSERHVSSLLPGQEKDVHRLAKIGWARDDKFTWLPYQLNPGGEDLLAYNEYYEQGWEKVPVLLDKRTGEHAEWEGDKDRIGFILSQHPELTVVQKQKQYIKNHILVNDVHMRSEKNQFGLNEYPMAPFMGIFEPESDNWDLKVQSLVRCQIDPQKETNKRRSQMIDMQDSQINSGWIAKKSAVINPRSLFQTSQGKVVWRSDNSQPTDIEKIQPAQIPQGMFELQRQFDQDIMNILGVNDASFGATENAQESGLMMMLRQGASIINLQDIFDNLRYAQKLISKKVLKMIQTWSPAKVRRILNRDPDPNFYNKDIVKYDVSVQEGVLTDTQKQIYFKQLIDLKQITDTPNQGPITAMMVAKAAPIQDKSTLNKEIEANVKSQQEQAQKAEQVQQQVLQSQLELNKATAVERLAGGKERFTRSVANMGLEDERAARAVDNRASAALDRARAMSEISKMSDERLMKYLQIVEMMEEMNRVKEEQVKQDDVEISARGQEAATMASPSSPLESAISPEQLNQQTAEV